jgi:hypothetical protein
MKRFLVVALILTGICGCAMHTELGGSRFGATASWATPGAYGEY